MRLAAIVGIVAIGGVLAGCGDDSGDEGEVTMPAEATGAEAQPASGSGAERKPKQPQRGEALEVSDSEYGSILVDSEDRTLYLFDKETGDASECYGACAEAWPPFLTEGEPQAGASADPKLLGTTERDDGTTQVTYGGHPLYYYVDEPAGEVLCHNVDEFGGLWLVVTPEGDPVQ